MKCFLVLAAVLVAASAYEGDLSKVIPRWRTMPSSGKVSPGGKIIGGEVVTPNSIPYQVGLFLTGPGGTFFCGGSLISNNYVLTAAHCVDGISSIEVHLGDHDIRTTEPNDLVLTSTEFEAHASYNPTYISNDIAYVKLPQSVTFNDAIQPVTLPTRVENYEGKSAIVSGWGKISDSAAGITDLLRSTVAPVMEWQECSNFWGDLVSSAHICTNPFTGHASCNGDSGGPLTVDGVQVGLVSFGSSAGCTAGPSAYTRISSYFDWIEQHTDVTFP